LLVLINLPFEVKVFFKKTLTSKRIEKPTYVVIDNAPTHTSDYFLAHLDEWEESGLYVIPLPAYSPELNIIEILWRKIKMAFFWSNRIAYCSPK
jgi:transposase